MPLKNQVRTAGIYVSLPPCKGRYVMTNYLNQILQKTYHPSVVFGQGMKRHLQAMEWRVGETDWTLSQRLSPSSPDHDSSPSLGFLGGAPSWPRPQDFHLPMSGTPQHLVLSHRVSVPVFVSSLLSSLIESKHSIPNTHASVFTIYLRQLLNFP